MIISGKDITRSNTSENALINTTGLFATIANIAKISLTEINDMLFNDGSEQFYKLNLGDLETTDLLQSTLNNSDGIIKNALTAKLATLK